MNPRCAATSLYRGGGRCTRLATLPSGFCKTHDPEIWAAKHKISDRTNSELAALAEETRQRPVKLARDWEALARNLAMILTNCADYLDQARANGLSATAVLIDTTELRSAFQRQAEVHGLLSPSEASHAHAR